MIQNLEKVEYRKGMLGKGMKPDDLPVKVWSRTKIPAEVRKAINEENPGSYPRSQPGSHHGSQAAAWEKWPSSDEQVQAAIRKKTPWIVRTLERLEGYYPLPTPMRYLSGETFVYLGRQYRLKVENGSRQPAKLLGRFLWVWVEDKTGAQSVKRSVDTWYGKRAHETLGRYVEKCYRIASRHGVPEPALVIRFMRRRWASCSSSGRISLNVNLVKVPVHCIEYVIMYELCHLKNHNHSKGFYSLLTRCLPDWHKRKETLDKFRLS